MINSPHVCFFVYCDNYGYTVIAHWDSPHSNTPCWFNIIICLKFWNISRPWANVRLCEVVDYDTIISSDKSFLSEPTQFVAEGLMKWRPIKDKNNLFCSLRAKKLNWLSESGPDEIHSPLADVFNRYINSINLVRGCCNWKTVVWCVCYNWYKYSKWRLLAIISTLPSGRVCHFYAATKKLYVLLVRLPVRLSVCPSHLFTMFLRWPWNVQE